MRDRIPLLTSGELSSFGGLGIVLALLLVVALRILLPKGDRQKIRLPLALLALHITTLLLRVVIPGDAAAQHPLEIAAAVFLLVCIGRAGFLFGIDWLLGHRLKQPVSRIFRDILQVLVYIGVGLLALRAMGFDPSSLLTTSALLTAIIGLSLQETLGNLFAGLAIQAERPFEVGDWVQVERDEAQIGRVIEINWRATKIITNDMVEVIVPNAILAKAPLRNFTQPTKVSRRYVDVSGSYDAPPRNVCVTLLQAIRGAEGVLTTPAPEVLVHGFADSGIVYRVFYFIDRFERRYPIDSGVRSRLWYALKRAGVTIPYPVRDVRMTDMSTRRSVASTLSLEVERTLSSVDFLKIVPPELIGRLASRVEILGYTTGEDIIVQGDEGDELFVVLSGELAVLLDSGGSSREIARLGTGKFFGEMSLMTGERRSATVRALTECQLLVVRHDSFQEVLSSAPDLAENMSRILAKRRTEIDEHTQAVDASSGAESARGKALLSRIKAFFAI